MLIGPWAVYDGLGIVLVRSFFRLAVWVRFFDPLGVVWGRFRPRFGSSWAAFWAILGSPGLVLDTPAGILESYNL